MNTKSLECPGPDKTVSYVIETSPTATATTSANGCDATEEKLTAISGSVVTAVLKRRNVRDAHTLSFIVDSDQVVGWVNEMAKGLSVDDSSLLKANISGEENGDAVAELRITRISKERKKPSGEEEKQVAETYREAANDLFRTAKNYKDHRKVHLAYNRAMNFGGMNDKKLQLAIRSNLSMLAIRMHEYPLAVIDADSVDSLLRNLDDHEDDEYKKSFKAKAHYRRSCALYNSQFFFRALHEIAEAEKIKPTDPMIRKEHARQKEAFEKCMTKRKDQFAEVYSFMPTSKLFRQVLYDDISSQ